MYKSRRNKLLLEQYTELKDEIEKFFWWKTVFSWTEYNVKNNRVYANRSNEASVAPRIEWGRYPSSLMVWWEIPAEGVTKLNFWDAIVKNKSQNYRKGILEGAVRPLIEISLVECVGYSNERATAHRTCRTQYWLRENVPAFISVEEWLSGLQIWTHRSMLYGLALRKQSSVLRGIPIWNYSREIL